MWHKSFHFILQAENTYYLMMSVRKGKSLVLVFGWVSWVLPDQKFAVWLLFGWGFVEGGGGGGYEGFPGMLRNK